VCTLSERYSASASAAAVVDTLRGGRGAEMVASTIPTVMMTPAKIWPAEYRFRPIKYPVSMETHRPPERKMMWTVTGIWGQLRQGRRYLEAEGVVVHEANGEEEDDLDHPALDGDDVAAPRGHPPALGPHELGAEGLYRDIDELGECEEGAR
jgi:hypothetical protein